MPKHSVLPPRENKKYTCYMIFTLLTILHFQNFTYVSNVRARVCVCMCVSVRACECAHAYSVAKLCLTLLRPHGLSPNKLLCPWNFPGKINEAGCHFLLQRICSTQGLDPHLLCLLHWQVDSLSLVPLGKSYASNTEPSVQFQLGLFIVP